MRFTIAEWRTSAAGFYTAEEKFASAVYKAVLGAGARVRARVDTCTWPCDSTEDPVRCMMEMCVFCGPRTVLFGRLV